MAALEAFAFLTVCDPRFSFGKGTASSDRPERGPDQTRQFAGESIIGDVL